MADIRSLLDSAATYDPNYVYGALLPMRKNKKTKDVELALPGIFKDMAQAVTSPMRALEGKIDPMSPEAVTEAANIAGLLGGSSVAATGTRRMPRGQVNHTVWHGSPHKFDKFDMSKIGTGEGAQAYGHGLYFAEQPHVAQSYAVKGAAGGKMPTPPTPTDFMIGDSWYYKNGDKLVKKVGNSLDEIPVDKNEYGAALRQAQAEFQKANSAGEMYKVDIPDEILPRMLDWDKPLSQQAPEVQKAMANVIEKKNPRLSRYFKESAGLDEAGQAEVRKRLGINIFDTVDTGGAAYQSAGQGNVEGLLKSMGIPGIRYLDGNSRGVGGTSNFVLFDDRLPRIIERNGVPTGLKPWKDDPEALRGLLGM